MTDTHHDDAGNAGGARRKRKIIIVDDSELVLNATSEILKRADYRVLTRNSPSGCVAMILQEKPDLVLLDVGMPAVSGDTLIKLLVTAAPNSKTILLLFSGMEEDELRARAKACGAHGYVTKTYNPAVLLRTINRWLPRPLGSSQGSYNSLQAAASTSDPVRAVGRRSGEICVLAPAMAEVGEAGPASVRASGETKVFSPMRASGESRVPELRPSIEVRAPAPAVSGEMRVSRHGSSSASFNAVDGPRVLFLDDDMMVLSGYRRQLHGQPFVFEFALSGNEALRRLTSSDPPSLVVADLVMPEPGGAEVFRRALAHDSSWSRRFVIVTGVPLQNAKRQLDSRFCSFLFQKPVMTEELSAAIRECLGLPTPYAVARSAGAL